MTLEEIKARVNSLGYMPEWLKEALADVELAPVQKVVLPVTAPPTPPSKKWCPMTRLNPVQTGGSDSFNRMIRVTAAEDGSTISETLLTGAYCIQSSCQLWTGADCGLKTMSFEIAGFIDHRLEAQGIDVDGSDAAASETDTATGDSGDSQSA